MEKYKLTNSKFSKFIAEDRISVSQFVESWTAELKEELSWIACSDMIRRNADDLKTNRKVIKSLETDLNISQLVSYSIKKDKVLIENVSSNLELGTLDHGPTQKSKVWANCKYRHPLIDKPTPIAGEHSSCGVNHTTQPVALISVQFFKPATKENNRFKPSIDQEFQVLSCQSLADLRDSYVCLSDVLTDQDYSLTPPEQEPSPGASRHDRFGFFLIDDTFFVDNRVEDIPLDQVTTWTNKRIDHEFATRQMQSTRLQDLTIRLGFPYLYMHRNHCEHLVVFSDLRLFLPRLDGGVDRYPKCTLIGQGGKVKCQMCSLFFAKWVTFDNPRLPLSPYYFCKNCFISFNYDSDGNKVGSFRAFPLSFNLDNQ